MCCCWWGEGGGAVTTDLRRVITVYDAEESNTSNHTLMLGEQIFRILSVIFDITKITCLMSVMFLK